MIKALEAQGIKVAADISTDPGQVDFSGAVLKAKQSNADALFVYTNEEESARALRELKKQGYDKPIVGETTLTGQKVIELAGEAANGAIAHVGLTADAPQADDQGVRRQVPEGIQVQERPQRHEGLQRHVRRQGASPRRTASSTPRLLAKALHGAKISAKDNPGVLLDVTFDATATSTARASWSRSSTASRSVTETLPPAGASSPLTHRHPGGPPGALRRGAPAVRRP